MASGADLEECRVLLLTDRRKPSIVQIRRKLTAVRRRRFELAAKSMRLVQKVVANRQFMSTEREVTKALIPFFVEQGRSMAARLRRIEQKTVENLWTKRTSLGSAAGLIQLIFDPKEWRTNLTNRLLPVLARKMAEAGVAHLMTLGIDVRRKQRKKGLKTTTAADWAEENIADWDSLVEAFEASNLPMGIMNEIPTWMQESIAERLSESFAEDYWDSISKTTMGDAEKVLRQGLSEGWSIGDMAGELRQYFEEGGFRYARRRSENIARTESGNALNAARKGSVARLQQELGPEVPMKQSWLSVLGITTRDTHAELDGVPENERGMWVLSGYEIPWPGHISLPPSERCNCFPAGTLVSGDFVGAQRAWYEGTFTEIITGSGRRITTTPQHPIVTLEGLVPAGEVKPGQKVLAYRPEADLPSVVASRGDDVKNEPVAVEQLFEAFLAGTVAASSSIEVKRAQVDDFYGDAKSFQGDIEIVRANWGLLDDGKFGQFEKRGNSVLICVDSGLVLEFRDRSFGLASGRIGSSPSSGPRLAEPLLSCLRSIASITPSGSLSVGVAADFHVRLDQSLRQDGPGISGFLRESLERYAGLVQFDDVVEVRDFYSAGHVYDLQSRWGLVVASDPLYTDNRFPPSGIVVSNCQCSLTIEFGMDPAEAMQRIEEYWQHVEEWESKGYVWPWQKYNPNRDPATGRFAPGGGGDDGGGASGREEGRAERARRAHKTSTAEKQRRGEAEQKRMAKAIGGENDGDNKPFDVIVGGKHGIEVKTVMDNNNDKITVHPESRRRKEAAAKKQKLKIHTIAIDIREGKRSYYYREGVGAFRLKNMEKVSLRQLKEKFR